MESNRAPVDSDALESGRAAAAEPANQSLLDGARRTTLLAMEMADMSAVQATVDKVAKHPRSRDYVPKGSSVDKVKKRKVEVAREKLIQTALTKIQEKKNADLKRLRAQEEFEELER